MSQLLPLSTVTEVGSLRLQVTSNSKGQTQIDLNHRKLGLVPGELFHFTHVQVLKLSDNEINHLPSAVSRLRNLKVLHLDTNNLTELPDTLVNCKHLVELNLSANSLQHLPSTLCRLTKLRVLVVSDNQLQHLPHHLGSLRQLRHLVLHRNQLWFLPFSVSHLTHLWSLNLSGNLFDNVPLPVCRLSSLHTLTLSGNRLASLPPHFDNLRHLRELDLSDNRFTSVELPLLRLTQLKYLNLSANRLETLPLEMSRLKQLKVLHVQKNNIHSVADVFPNVQYLNLARNNLTVLSVWEMYKLENLKLSDNKMEVLPHGLSRLRNLRSFQIDRNQLREVTPDISKLRKLETLDLSDNKLTYLPLPVYQMASLRSFNIHGNSIPALPIGSVEPLHRDGEETMLEKGGAYGEINKIIPTTGSNHVDNFIVKQKQESNPFNKFLTTTGSPNVDKNSDNLIIKQKLDHQQESIPTKNPGSKSFSFFKRKSTKTKTEVSGDKGIESHQSVRSYAIMKSKTGTKRKKNISGTWNLNNTLRSSSLGELEAGTTRKKNTKASGTWDLNNTLPPSSSPLELEAGNVRLSDSLIRLTDPMSVLSTAEFEVDEIQADFSSEDEDGDESDSVESGDRGSIKVITRGVVSPQIPVYKPTTTDVGRESTDYNLLGLCSQLESMMNKNIFQPAFILNTGLDKRFSEKRLKRDGEEEEEEEVCGIEYSPLETFTITVNGGHYVSNYDVNIQIDVPSRAVNTTVHSTIQVLKINTKVLNQVQKLNRFAENVIEIGPIVMMRLTDNNSFHSQVKIAIPAPRTEKGHLMLLTIQGDNSCVPTSSGFQYNRGVVTFNSWHFTKRVAIVTKAKCKYKACKSMEQILQCLGLVDSV